MNNTERLIGEAYFERRRVMLLARRAKAMGEPQEKVLRLVDLADRLNTAAAVLKWELTCE